jgi:GNAT superfamily N-acetyltransferase/uncharacterized glyoxalase superfamily protein PhnB
MSTTNDQPPAGNQQPASGPQPVTDPQPVFSHAEPVLSVQDVTATIQYWQDVLGFPVKWTWGDPPNIGAVSWQNIHVQFLLDPEHAIRSKGSSIWIRLQRLDLLYRIHQERKADIVAPLAQQPWGLAQYTIRDINGHYVTFAGLVEERSKSEATLPSTVRIVGRIPTVKEFQQVQAGVGWGGDVGDTAADAAAADAKTAATLAAVLHAVVAEDTASGAVIGCALLLGDRVGFYYVKDVMVHKDWQGKRVGTALMQELTGWLEKNVTHHALVGLFSRDTLEPFYKQFGFTQSFAMLRYMNP